jgi:hypothetical protein
MAAAKEDSNDKTIDQQNIDESKQLAKASDSSNTRTNNSIIGRGFFNFKTDYY